MDLLGPNVVLSEITSLMCLETHHAETESPPSDTDGADPSPLLSCDPECHSGTCRSKSVKASTERAWHRPASAVKNTQHEWQKKPVCLQKEAYLVLKTPTVMRIHNPCHYCCGVAWLTFRIKTFFYLLKIPKTLDTEKHNTHQWLDETAKM